VPGFDFQDSGSLSGIEICHFVILVFESHGL